MNIIEPCVPERPAPAVRMAVEDALRGLGAGPSLLVALNDPQRHTDSRAVLRELVGLRPGLRLRILVACGSHAFGPASRAAFERDVLGGLPVDEVAWHDSRAAGGAVIGGAWRGHPWLADGGPLLAIGSVEPHYFAGFSGAHKTCTIGCASYADIESNHAGALRPDSQPGRLEGNPVHEGIMRMARALEALRPVAAVNLVQAGAAIVHASGGTLAGSLAQSAAAAAACFIRLIDQPADALVLDVDRPLGDSFYQAEKGIKNSEWAVRDGGAMVLRAPCGDGIGQDQFVGLLRVAGTWEAADRLVRERGYRLGDHKAVRLRYLTDPARRAVRLFVVSAGLSAADARLLGVEPAGSAEEALERAGVAGGRVWRVRNAGNVVVRVRPSALAGAPGMG